LKSINFRSEKGFTLIELLIVIVIIGILAVAVLAAINPMEQMRRARDTGKKSNARELLNAIERYVTSQGTFPQDLQTSAEGGSYSLGTAVQASSMGNLLSDLSGALEIKSGALKGAALSDLYITRASDDSLSICFDPESNKFQADADNARGTGQGYNQDGTDNDNCSTSTCYVCVPD